MYDSHEGGGRQGRPRLQARRRRAGRASADALKGFAIAGRTRSSSGPTRRSTADQVVVSSPEVTQPVAVRYGWADNPDCNLYNKEGLPASPFRTDDWPGVTANNH